MTAAGVAAAAGLMLASATAAASSDAPASPRGAPAIALLPIATISGGNVTVVTHAGDGSGRLFVVAQTGAIHVIQGGSVLPTPFLDTFTPPVQFGGERGLLGLAFHPNYETNGYFYVYYNRQPDDQTVLARYTVSATDPSVADPASAMVLLTMAQPNENHNGGDLHFGPDGYLYIAKGDGGNGGNEARDLSSLLGKLLRIDVDNGSPYAIPPTNPFVGTPGARPEIWDRGLRNPWRFSFDRQTGDLFIGDVGELRWEEVDFEAAGGPGGVDYGWNVMEANECYQPPTGCIQTGLTLPILQYPTPFPNCSVIGGFRYRGAASPSLQGVYFYGDYCSGQIWAAEPTGPTTWSGAPVLSTGLFIGTFGEDETGEIYVGDTGLGRVYRIVQAGGTPALSIGDVAIDEGNAGAVQATFTLTLAPAAAGPVTVEFATANDTAQAGQDYTATMGTVTFPAGATSASIDVPVLGDALDEYDEAFLVNLANPSPNAVLGDGVARALIRDDDVPPAVSIGDAVVNEGNAGMVDVTFTATLSTASGREVAAYMSTIEGTALEPEDFTSAFVHLVFPAGTTTVTGNVSVNGDTLDEPDERFLAELVDLDGAVIGDGLGRGTIRDDDGGPRPLRELTHRASVRTDLAALPGPLAREELYLISQQPFSSYEVVVDAASGDLSPNGDGPRLELVDGDLSNVIMGSVPAGAGPARSLRWEHDAPAVFEGWYVRVASDGCGTDCGADDVYRVRAYDTTLLGPRFNNSGTQVTVLILQNASRETAGGTVSFWRSDGTRLGNRIFELEPQASMAINTGTVPGVSGQSGSLTVSNSAPYGTLTGKTVALEPATGYSFDAPLAPRP